MVCGIAQLKYFHRLFVVPVVEWNFNPPVTKSKSVRNKKSSVYMDEDGISMLSCYPGTNVWITASKWSAKFTKTERDGDDCSTVYPCFYLCFLDKKWAFVLPREVDSDGCDARFTCSFHSKVWSRHWMSSKLACWHQYCAHKNLVLKRWQCSYDHSTYQTGVCFLSSGSKKAEICWR